MQTRSRFSPNTLGCQEVMNNIEKKGIFACLFLVFNESFFLFCYLNLMRLALLLASMSLEMREQDGL